MEIHKTLIPTQGLDLLKVYYPAHILLGDLRTIPVRVLLLPSPGCCQHGFEVLSPKKRKIVKVERKRTCNRKRPFGWLDKDEAFVLESLFGK